MENYSRVLERATRLCESLYSNVTDERTTSKCESDEKKWISTSAFSFCSLFETPMTVMLRVWRTVLRGREVHLYPDGVPARQTRDTFWILSGWVFNSVRNLWKVLFKGYITDVMSIIAFSSLLFSSLQPPWLRLNYSISLSTILCTLSSGQKLKRIAGRLNATFYIDNANCLELC